MYAISFSLATECRYQEKGPPPNDEIVTKPPTPLQFRVSGRVRPSPVSPSADTFFEATSLKVATCKCPERRLPVLPNVTTMPASLSEGIRRLS